MKKYKLVKDLPTFELGDEFILKKGIGLQHVLGECNGAIIYTEATLEKFPNILTDWFEEIKESTRWKPEISHDYYYISGDGNVYDNSWDDSRFVDNGRFEIGNCFKTEEEAKRIIEYLKALAVVRGDGTSNPARNSNNWHVSYDIATKCLYTSFSFNTARNGTFGLPYFATTEDAQRSIEQHKKEWLTIFGFEDSAEEGE